MKPPRISARRLFWSATLAACVWAFVGGRTSAPESRNAPPSLLQRTQGLAGETVSTFLTPAKFIFTGVQSVAANTVDRLTAHHEATESVDSLHQTIAQLTDELDQRDRQIRLDEEVLTATKALAPQGLRADELLIAGVTGYQAGPGASLLTLDKGTADGIRRGMVVTACATTAAGVIPQASILGAVDTAWAKTATVRLLTDPHVKIQAKLVRRSTGGSTVLTPEPCLVEGMGDGKLHCSTISVGQALAEPEIGDIMQLADQNWPAAVQYMVIGEVSSVARKDSQLLRYDLSIVPRVNLNSVQSVLVVLKQ
jgi:cell shape-determining protein MreC